MVILGVRLYDLPFQTLILIGRFSNLLFFCLVIDRCALTFLAIQEPYISMFCSVCDTNFLSHNQGIDFTLDGQLQGDEGSENGKEVYDMLYERYDVCAYCGGKYQDE